MPDYLELTRSDLEAWGYTELSLLSRTDSFLTFRARSPEGQSVLLKTPASDTTAPSFVDQLKHELEVAGDLNPEYVARPIRIERRGDLFLLILEGCDYPPLTKLLKTPMGLTSYLTVATGIAEALSDIHRHGLVLKRITPNNILALASGQVKLTGFASASRLTHERVTPTTTELVASELAYTAPELTGRINRSVDYRSDLYALGIVLYQMLTNQIPFTASDPMEWVHCHIAVNPEPPCELLQTIPEPLSDMVMKLLAKAPEDRYQTAEGLKADLSHCLDEWRTSGHIRPFQLGVRDIPDHLMIPEKLYGRDRDITTLMSAYEKASTKGKPELVLISGYSGIGKSSIVNELHKMLLSTRALFAGGKFDQYKRDTPYSSIAQLLQALVQQVLGESEQEITKWRDAIQQAVEPNGRLITNLAPDLEALIGQQPPVQEVPPQDALNRFNTVFRRLISAFTRSQQPLVLFLDDLQWLDAATLQLVEHLITHPEIKNILLLGAYRENEVSPTHPLMLMLDSVKHTGTDIRAILLGPLLKRDISQLIADTIHCDVKQAEPLSDLVYEKTGGNPFFTRQFLTLLADEKLLWFDPHELCWHWDLKRIQAKGFTDNIADLMIGKIKGFKPETQETLKQLACLGNEATQAVLALIQETTEDEIESKLQEAIREGFLYRHKGKVSFLHDRVQEAAYSLISQNDLARLHLNIGRKLLSQSTKENTDDRLFDIVNHLNHGSELIEDPNERTKLAELNAAAARRARTSIAFSTARDLFAAASRLIPDETWEDRFEFNFALFLDWAETEYLTGTSADAEQLLDTLLTRARTDHDRAAVYRVRLTVYPLEGKYDEAVAIGQKALQLFGEIIPDDDESLAQAIESEAAAVKEYLREHKIADFATAPDATDEKAKAVAGILTGMGGPAYIGSRPQIYPLLALKNLHCALKYGMTAESSHAFSGYAHLVVSTYDDPYTAYELSELALSLSERFGDLASIGSVLYLHGNHINFWRNPFASDFPILERGFRVCIDAGNLIFAGYIAYSVVWQAIERGDTLSEALEFSRKYESFALGSHNEAIYQSIVLQQQFMKCLLGETNGDISFSEEGLDEISCLEKIEQAAFTCGIAYYHIMKILTAYLMGDDNAAQYHAEEAGKIQSAVLAQPMEVMYFFLHSLVLSRTARNLSAEEQDEVFKTLESYSKKLSLWAESCSDNFACKHALVAANIAALKNDNLSAEQLYEQAIVSAKTSGFTHWQAFAHEAAAHFYEDRGLVTSSRAHLRQARFCYIRWGARAKVDQLDAAHPWLLEDTTVDHGSISSHAHQLDLMAIVKAQHAISGEIDHDKLVEVLLRILMENAGAQNGYLFVEPNFELFAASGPHGEIAFQPSPLSSLPGVANSIINYVKRTGSSVILADASRDPGSFANDKHLLKTKPKSILCLPIQRHAEPLGAVYLENNLTANAFTQADLYVLEILASQTAISLENAQTYAALKESETRYQRMFETSNEGIWIQDENFRTTFVNEHMAQMLGYTAAELLGHEVTEFMHPEDAPDHAHKMEERSRGLSDVYERRMQHKNGSTVWMLISASPVFEEGRFHGSFSMLTDITERKLAEQKLISNEHLFRTLVENSPNFIARYDLDLNRVYINPALQKLFRVPVDQALGKTILTSSPLDEPEHYMNCISKVIRTGQECSDEITYRDAAGEIHWGSTRFAPELGLDGKVESVIAISHDITDRKLAELERLDHMHFLEKLDRINRVLQESGDIEQIMKHALDEILDIFACDRAFLIYPCDPEAPTWSVVLESTKPEYPGAGSWGPQQMDEGMSWLMRTLLGYEHTVQLGAGGEYSIPTSLRTDHQVLSLLTRTLKPRSDVPWMFGVIQCSHERTWTAKETDLLEETGNRLSDSLTNLVITRDLRESEERFRLVYENSPVPTWEQDFSAVKPLLDSLYQTHNSKLERYLIEHPEVVTECTNLIRIININSAALELHEATDKEQLLEGLTKTFLPESYDAIRSELIALSRGETELYFDGVVQTLTGKRRDVSISFSVCPGYEETLDKVFVSLIDITQRKHDEERQRLAASVFSTSQEGILISDANNRIIDINPAFTHLTGYSREEALGRDPGFLASGRQTPTFYAEMWESLKTRGEWQGELWNRRKSGDVYPELLSIVAVKDEEGQLQHYVGAFSDISMLKQHEDDLDRIAHYDMLTSVPNRRLLGDRLEQAIAHARRHQKNLAVCYLDLDGFKPINDQFGHEGGDRMLIEIAHRLESMSRGDDTVARLGGDEFVLLWNDIGNEADCIQVLERVLKEVSEPMKLATTPVSVSASIGVTLYPDDNVDADSLLRHADHAMYTAKQLGKNRYQIFDARMERQLSAQSKLLQKIKHGLQHGQFELYYQPKVDYIAGKVIGVEALLRWNDPVLGLVGPKEFLSLIENDSMAFSMGRWIIDQAVQQARNWHEQGITLPISINIFPRHLKYRAFIDDLRDAIETHWPQMPKHRLQMEIVESTDLEELEPIEQVIRECVEMGIGFSLDDFGTGYSSLVYLRRLSIEELKIDQSFVRDMLDDPNDEAIVVGVISLGKAFDLRVVAEGVETARQAEHLVELGCSIVQGYGLGRPMPAESFQQWLAEYTEKELKLCRN